jgi:hypothetical protein
VEGVGGGVVAGVAGDHVRPAFWSATADRGADAASVTSATRAIPPVTSARTRAMEAEGRCLPLPLLALLPLAACGDLPQPFAGRPGANALRLATPPPARLVVPPPTNALLANADAVRLAHETADALVAAELPAYAEAPRPGDWQLSVTATMAAGQVQPHFTVVDADGRVKGDVNGDAVPAAAWSAGDPTVLHAAAAAAAPEIVSLLRSADASAKQSDPNSLYNRPARIYLVGVSGAPGDGNQSLTIQMRHKLPETGDMLTRKAADADFTVRGVVKITDEPGHQQQVEIHWLVTDATGKLAGDVAQGHDIAQGSLDHYWADVADAVAAEAAGGVHEVITNWSGRKRKA